ncbi:MAG: endo-1,4-beta-xylanase [Planctomycetes bacterium]|nr:endo-1,4-beta-xylanase [Planctomycetota bacterium]
MQRFAFFPRSAGGPLADLRGAYLVGADSVPAKGELRLEGEQIVCESRSLDPIGLSLLWRIQGDGVYQLETTRLLPRAEPYHLHIELARHRLMRISMKREEWGLFDYPGMETIANLVDEARDKFVDALGAVEKPERAAKLADASLARSIQASEEMCRFHASVFLTRRQQAGGFARPFLGVTLPGSLSKQPLKSRVVDVFDFARVPFSWREIQPKEQGATYETCDQAIKACAKLGLPIRGGPLLSFGVTSVPDWMYIWENDYDAISDFAREHIRRTVSRYSSQISNWIVASGLHADSVFSFTFEQIIDLTRTAVSVTRQSAPRSQILLELTQPWGEYYARNQRTVPPMLYAEMAVQSGIPFDAFGLQLIFGLDAEGFHLRDTLQISSLIDRLANLGKPIHLTSVAVPNSGSAGGATNGSWTDASQAEWLVNLLQNALSKPYVESAAMQCLCDGANASVPGCGVLREDGSAKPAYTQLAQLRASLQGEGRK